MINLGFLCIAILLLFHYEKIKQYSDTDMMENHGLKLYFVSNANKLNLFTNIPVFVKSLDAHTLV